MSLAVLILAAGEGTRMKSAKPKVLHKVCGVPMIEHVLAAAASLQPDRTVVVLGTNREAIVVLLPPGTTVAIQEKPLGTGHAVLAGGDALADCDDVVVLSGDSPLIKTETLERMLAEHRRSDAAATVLTCRPSDPNGYGRIVRKDGRLDRIVEELDADAETRCIDEVNTGTYAFNVRELLTSLGNLGNDNAKGEYYLTDCIADMRERGMTLAVHKTDDPEETMGVNSRVQLAEAERVMRDRVRERWMLEGVTMLDPATVYIDCRCTLEKDVTIMPSTLILGDAHIGEGSLIGPFSFIDSARIGKGVRAIAAQILEAEIGDGAEIGPYARIRPGTVIEEGAKVGTFVELKKTHVGKDSKVPHLSYMGDTTIGSGVNVGAGTITCNYDGFEKFATRIEDGAFIGSDTMLVAPVIIGAGAMTGAGSTITEDVPPDALALSRSKQSIIEGYARKRKELKGKKE